MNELMPIVRIAMHWLAWWLIARGFPPEVAHAISTDPAFAELAAQIAGGLISLASLIWWRIARRMRWPT